MLNKSYVLLKMYDLIITDGISLSQWCSSYHMSLSTFRRYVSLLRSFLWQEHGKIIVYDRDEGTYKVDDKNFPSAK